MIELNLEGVGVIVNNGELIGVIKREEKSGHQVFYKCIEMGLEDIQEVFKKACSSEVENRVEINKKNG